MSRICRSHRRRSSSAISAEISRSVLKLTTLDRENDVLSEPLIWWMKTVAERTSNRVQFQPFWSQSLVPVTRLEAQ